MVKKTNSNEKEGGVEKSILGGLKVGGISQLGSVQKEVLELLTGDEALKIPQVANRRQTTIQAVYTIVWKLKKKGYLEGSAYRGFNNPAHSTCRGVEKSLHSQRFRIGIIGFTTSKEKYLGKIGNVGVSYLGSTIKLRSDCVEIYSRKHFKELTLDDCTEKAAMYWLYYLDRLQSRYGLVLMKQGHDNVKEIYAHVADLNNGLALRQNILRDRIFYFDKGKLYLVTDKSFKGNDLEFQGKSAVIDSKLFEPHLKCFRDPNQATPRELQNMVAGVIQAMAIQNNNNLYIPETLEEKKKKNQDLLSYVG